MNLGDQLSELRFNILRDRSDIIAGDTDSLWSDETLLRYIADAERRFARRTLIIRDATTPEVTRFNVQNGVVTYPAHESVLAVISAKFNTATSDLLRGSHAMITPAPPEQYMQWNAPLDFSYPPGPPVAYWTDEGDVYARETGRLTVSLFPTPSATQAGQPVTMRVVRLPLTCYGKSDLERASEIPEDYQLDVLEWAAFRAQRTWDGDAGAPTTAADHKAAFEEAIERAKQEIRRKMFSNIGFRYGRNGFNYTR